MITDSAANCGYVVEIKKCLFANWVSEIRVFHDLQTLESKEWSYRKPKEDYDDEFFWQERQWFVGGGFNNGKSRIHKKVRLCGLLQSLSLVREGKEIEKEKLYYSIFYCAILDMVKCI